MTRMSCSMPSAPIVSAFRLWETAVTRSDRSMQNATTRAYDGSLPTSVMSVPCRVVTVLGVATPGAAASISRAMYAAAACGTA